MTDPTPAQILALPMPTNDADAATVRDALIHLLAHLWDLKEDFSSKRPYGNSGWMYPLYEALGNAGYIRYETDENGYCADVDDQAADRLIAAAIQQLPR